MAHRDVTSAMADHWKAEHDKVKTQRDQLREALSSIVECWDGPLYKHEMLPRIQQARAALKATEDE